MSADDVIADFLAAAQDWPARVAVQHGELVLTYRELAQLVADAAACHRLGRSGTDGESRPIGVVVSHTPSAVVQLLSVLHAGDTYCPIEATLPDARKRALAAALGLKQLYAADAVTDAAIGIHSGTAESADAQHRPAASLPSDSAYVLCTSGSTGTPKPVVVSRQALSITVRALRRLFGLTPHDRVLQFASLGWDTCLEEILPTLSSGAALVFDEEAHARSMPRFVRMLAEREITVLDIPTAFWHELVLYLDETQTSLPHTVRVVVIGGERVDPTRLRQWRERDLRRVRLLNTYGCTETTMITHAAQLSGPGTDPHIAAAGAQPPLGSSLPHVVDHVTERGELLVSGPSLATGYLGMPEATAAAFEIADHGDGPRRWFHTGDLVVRGSHGLLHSLGRADEELKVLGVRVHPAEVEAHLNTHPAVAGSVVVGEHTLGRMSLTACVALTATTSAAELKQFLRERLPSQFVPARVKVVAALSYTDTGKIDRQATWRAAAEFCGKGSTDGH
ncbi:AMP-binding protein [Mycobacterium sp. ACS4331]|uniref:AMP-binding protein n=1 Tax=Mycobacterium sp. ACS4331 TaxID=1834121 RepID=UPI001E35F5CF|nr:AMP-binding protein [Mycobacterium sp. ACS4331]